MLEDTKYPVSTDEARHLVKFYTRARSLPPEEREMALEQFVSAPAPSGEDRSNPLDQIFPEEQSLPQSKPGLRSWTWFMKVMGATEGIGVSLSLRNLSDRDQEVAKHNLAILEILREGIGSPILDQGVLDALIALYQAMIAPASS
jgi:hypothetical protein